MAVISGVVFRAGLVRGFSGFSLSAVVMVGVFLGAGLFRPTLARFYKTFCLILLVVLSAIGIFRMF